jgi:hypothetical protein
LDNFKGGKLSDYLDKWCTITSDHEILQTIRGLPINISTPAEMLKSPYQHKLSDSEIIFLESEIQTLLAKKVIKEVCPELGEFISPIFTRDKKDGGCRLILNLKNLNLDVPYKHFKMETVSSILTLVRPGWYMAKIDLKDAYYSVKILPADQKLLKFRHNGELYKFVCLPNGYSEGPRVFTKLLKPVLALLRDEGICLAIYIDDLFTTSETYESCFSNVKRIASLLDDMGFTINLKKSFFVPSQVMEFLGFSIDSKDMMVTLTKEKKVAIKAFCKETLNKVSIPIRHAVCLLGKFNSSCLAVPFGKLHFRDLDRDKTSALFENKWNFDKYFTLSDLARADIRWWASNILEASAPITRGMPTDTLTTDASGHGWGAVLDEGGTGGLFTALERSLHINVKETMAVRFGLESLCEDTTDCHFRLMIDNQAAVGAINKMGSSKSRTLDKAVKDVWEWSSNRNCWLTACYIPGKLNVEADALSRDFDSMSEWMLDPGVFAFITERLDFRPDIDLMATRINKQMDRFMAYRPDPDAFAIDAFSWSWKGFRFYCFPPFACISRILQKVSSEDTIGILVTPDWKNQVWYSYLRIITIKEINLPYSDHLLLDPTGAQRIHPMAHRMRLRASLVGSRGQWR